MSNALKFAAGGSAAPLYVDDVFSAYTYTGNGSTQAIVNGIDLAGEGGLTWFKGRDVAAGHMLFDTSRGVSKYLISNLTNAEGTSGAGERLTSFNSDGFTLGTDPGSAINAASNTYASWTFRNAPDFYHHDVVTKTAGSNATYNFSTITTLGMVRVKRTDAIGSWYIWHRSLSAGKLLIGESAAAEATLGHITVSGTTVTLVNGVIADGTYLVEAFAHDDSADGLIQCFTFTEGAADADVTLGFEPQFVSSKAINTTSNYFMWDVSRGITTGGADPYLLANSSNAEATGSDYVDVTATGFKQKPILGNGTIWIGLAIRRSNKPPTSGTQVYSAIARTGTGAAATVTGVGFTPDLAYSHNRSAGYNALGMFDRLRGVNKRLDTSSSGAEISETISLTEFGMDGISVGADGTYGSINFGGTYINHFFRRAPGFFDEVCYTGDLATNSQRTHNLGVIPELIIIKSRTGADNWVVRWSGNTTNNAFLNTTAGFVAANYINGATATYFQLANNSSEVNNAFNYVAYLFATLAGISKVGSYTGNGSSQTINCDFSAGARFILIKRTDSTGDWYLWDTVRGIVAGNDPHTSLNSTAAEVTTDDSIDPDASGFIVNQVAATNINVTAATYIFLAIA